MRITIDNGDGRGAVDYSGAVADEGPVSVQRMLNAPSRCTAEIVCGLGGLAVPVRLGRVVVTSSAGAVLFTGYLATEPVMVCAGEGTAGAVYTARLSAVSDEWLLDRAGSGVKAAGGLVLQTDTAAAVEQLAGRVLEGASALTIESSGTARALGAVALKASEPWSVNAGTAAGAGYASYRANGGQVLVMPAAAVAHSFSNSDGTLDVKELDLSTARELANDVTLSGAEEPAAYVSESFLGDGTTTSFDLSEAAFRASAGAERTPIRDGFAGAAIDSATWQVSDPSGAISLTSAGLTVSGGTGVDGQTFVRGLDLIELGGNVVAQLSGVVVGAASAGVLGGFFAGSPTPANCVAGFRVRQSAGVTVLVPLVNGAEVGTVFTPAGGHTYTLRVRAHCVEMLRVGQPYYCLVDGAVQSFGSAAGIEAPLDVVFEVVDEGASSNTPAAVLYDSAATGTVLTGVAGACSFAVVSAATMTTSIGAVSVTRPGSLWVVSTLPDGTKQTRLVGAAGQGVDCEASYGSSAGTPGKVTFFSGRVPVANERVTVMYRTSQRSVARLADAASITAEAAGGMGGVSRWIGKVLQPPARSSVDCENAAQAVLAFATSRSAALKGTYAVVNPSVITGEDVWPGDLLQITSDGATTPLLVRSVTVADGHAVPEVLRYKIAFANDWATELADGLGLKLSDEIASDAVLPETAANGPGEVLANLQQLALTSLSGTSLTIDAGIDPPSGGGFEVRRRDWLFGAGADPADLVIRSPVRSFSLTRAAQVERFYVRLYDASGTYSRFSSAVFVQAAVG